MPQPNSGRIGRSPGAVPRMIVIASDTSSSPLTRASPPRRSTRRGNATPLPMMSVAIALPRPQRDRGRREADLRALEVDAAGALDVHARVALQRQLSVGGDRHLAVRADLDVD